MGKREQIINTAIRYNGMAFKGGSHRTLIDVFNKYKPDGAPMTYTANFCAACASAVAYICGLGDAYPCSYNVGTIVRKAQQMGIWVENDNFTPSPGDWIVYDWNDNGRGDNTSGASHVGIVVSVSSGMINVFEFNIGNRHTTGYRRVAINGRFIRGFVHPNFQTTGWIQDNVGWWYRKSDGSYPKNTWQQFDGEWYYFNESGYAVTGWQQISGKWYYFGANCKMQTAWQSIDDKWYFLDPKEGSMYESGVHMIDGKNYFFNTSGAMQTGWQMIDGEWQHFEPDGARTEKGIVKGDKIYIIKDGKLVTNDDVEVRANEQGEISVK